MKKKIMLSVGQRKVLMEDYLLSALVQTGCEAERYQLYCRAWMSMGGAGGASAGPKAGGMAGNAYGAFFSTMEILTSTWKFRINTQIEMRTL